MKYELLRTPEHTIEVDGRKLYRIRALDYQTHYIGVDSLTGWRLGGHIECEGNLSQEGNCWVYNGGKVYSHAVVTDNALVKNGAVLSNGAELLGKSVIGAGVHAVGSSLKNVSLHGPMYMGAITLANLKLNLDCQDLPADKPLRLTFAPIIILNRWYTVIVSDNYLSLGCTTKTLADWRRTTEREVEEDLCANRNVWREWHDILFTIAEKHQARFAPQPEEEPKS